MNIGKSYPLPLCFFVVILSSWVCDNWVYRFPKSVEIMCFQRCKAYPGSAEKVKSNEDPVKSVLPHLRTTPFAQCREGDPAARRGFSQCKLSNLHGLHKEQRVDLELGLSICRNDSSNLALNLRSRPPFTGVLYGDSPKVLRRVLSESFLVKVPRGVLPRVPGNWECPRECS